MAKKQPPFYHRFYSQVNHAIADSKIIFKRNKKQINLAFYKRLKRLHRLYDLQFELAENCIWLLKSDQRLSPMIPLLSAFHKNMLTFLAGLELIELGLYGSARSLMRHAFENLIVGKYFTTENDDKLLKRWISGEPFSIKAEILNKIINFQPLELSLFWKRICRYSHASIYANQIFIDCIKTAQIDIWDAFNLIEILMIMNAYFLSDHYILFPKIKFRIQKLGNINKIGLLRDDLRAQTNDLRKHTTQTGESLFNEYTKLWKFI